MQSTRLLFFMRLSRPRFSYAIKPFFQSSHFPPLALKRTPFSFFEKAFRIRRIAYE